MGWFNEDKAQEAYNTAPEHANESSWSHELVGGAAGFYAMKKYEDYERSQGKPESHQLAKEIFAGFAAAEIDKLAETKGLDFIDREKAKRHAIQEAEQQGPLSSDRF